MRSRWDSYLSVPAAIMQYLGAGHLRRTADGPGFPRQERGRRVVDEEVGVVGRQSSAVHHIHVAPGRCGRLYRHGSRPPGWAVQRGREGPPEWPEGAI